jgi:hypothetical protein
VVKDKEEKEKILEALPYVAASTGKPDGPLADLLNEVLREQLEKSREEKEKKKKLVQAKIKLAESLERAEKEKKGSCKHIREDGSPRIGGQVLSNGQLCVMCLWCHETWFSPSKEGQKSPPDTLMKDPRLRSETFGL